MLKCPLCGRKTLHKERAESYDYCIECANSMPMPKPRVIVMGQHKGPPLVYSVDDPIVKRNTSNYDRG